MTSDTVSDTDVANADGEAETILVLVWMILRTTFLLILRYRIDFIGRIVSMYLFFAALFFGGKTALESVANSDISAFGSTIDALIVGWFLWTIVQSAYSSLSTMITQESRWGTLEQLYMSSYGFGTVIVTKLFGNILLSVITGSVLLVLMILTSGRMLSIDIVSIAPIILLAVLSAVGIGFAFAGLTLIYKKLDSISQLMQFVILGLITAPAATDQTVVRLLPIVQGSAMLQATMRNGVRLWEFSGLDIGLLVGTAAGYFVVGYTVFQYCSYVARKRGVMGHY